LLFNPNPPYDSVRLARGNHAEPLAIPRRYRCKVIDDRLSSHFVFARKIKSHGLLGQEIYFYYSN